MGGRAGIAEVEDEILQSWNIGLAKCRTVVKKPRNQVNEAACGGSRALKRDGGRGVAYRV